MTDEQAEILGWFTHLLTAATADGGKKRAAGKKVSWKVDKGHEAAMFRHLARWKSDPNGRDEDSGAHHLVAVAWRALAIVVQETAKSPYGTAEPGTQYERFLQQQEHQRRTGGAEVPPKDSIPWPTSRGDAP